MSVSFKHEWEKLFWGFKIRIFSGLCVRSQWMTRSRVQASATILKLTPIYFGFQGRQGHFNVPKSVKNNKKLTLKLCWLSLIKAVLCPLCFIGPICIWVQWMSVRLPGTQTSSRHSFTAMSPSWSFSPVMWTPQSDGQMEAERSFVILCISRIHQHQHNSIWNLSRSDCEFEFIKHSNKGIVYILYFVAWESVSKNGFNTFKLLWRTREFLHGKNQVKSIQFSMTINRGKRLWYL